MDSFAFFLCPYWLRRRIHNAVGASYTPRLPERRYASSCAQSFRLWHAVHTDANKPDYGWVVPDEYEECVWELCCIYPTLHIELPAYKFPYYVMYQKQEK